VNVFLRLTFVIAAIVIVLMIAGWLFFHILPIIIFAAIVAGLVLGGMFLYNFIRRAGSRA